MQIYLNRDNFEYKNQLNSDVYVDKTPFILELNKMIGKRDKYICVSRPRRFGKTMIIEMLTAYYSKSANSKSLFNKRKIAKYKNYDKYLNRFDTININFQNFFNNKISVNISIKKLETAIKNELASYYKNIFDKNDTLSIALEKIFNYNKNTIDFKYNGFIFIIDEWDAILRNKNIKNEDIELFLDFLRELFKDKVYIKLVYMTGILPIKKYGTHSALNMFIENSMLMPLKYGKYFGFLNEEVKEINKTKLKFDELKKYYDGYVIDKNKKVFNPKSICDALHYKKIANYWARTETFEALKIYIDINFDGIYDALTNLITNQKFKIDINSFQNDMTNFTCIDDIMTLLIHIGYLTYDANTSEVYIPNEEVREEFYVALKNGKRKELYAAIIKSEELLNATLNFDNEKVAKIIDDFHIELTDIKNYNKELALSNVIKTAYYMATKDRYIMLQEFTSGYGYADIVYLPKNKKMPAIIIELKFDKSAEMGIEQIINKKYYKSVMEFSNNILYVSINYNKKTKKHICIVKKISI